MATFFKFKTGKLKTRRKIQDRVSDELSPKGGHGDTGTGWVYLLAIWASAFLIHVLGDGLLNAHPPPPDSTGAPTAAPETAGRPSKFALENEEHAYRVFSHKAGDAILLFMALLVSAGSIRLGGSNPIKDRKQMLLLLTISTLSLAASKWLLVSRHIHAGGQNGYIVYLLPVTIAPMLMVILSGPIAAAAAGAWVSFAATVYASYNPVVLFAGIAAAMTTAQMGRNVRSRKRIIKIGIWAGAAMAACAAGFAFAAGADWPTQARQMACALINGTSAALVSLLLLPLIEITFGISTDITLLEYCDMQHPLLKKLAIEAPGTYHHSLVTANLAEAAADALGLNTLLVRVSAYFHDIGKLVKPGFFSENIQFSDNPHDQLSPAMSTLVIISHVKEGINLAHTYKLPQPVEDAVRQHHGTGLVSYFYHKGSAQQESDSQGGGSQPLAQEQFRYPGPKPRTREIAVLLLADSIEAASRSMEKVSPANIEKLINDIVESKIKDGQMDSCSITMAELHAVKKAFAFALVNMLHARISYSVNENGNKQPPVEAGSGRQAD